MSLKQFLAVGQSFEEIREQKSPFAMRGDTRLPTFSPSPRFSGRREQPAANELVQGELLPRKETKAVPVFTVAQIENERVRNANSLRSSVTAPGERAPAPVAGPKRKKGLLWYLSFGLLGRRACGGELVQSELSLEQVRVLRNDLADCDLELVERKRVQKPVEKPIRPVRSPETPPRTSSWNELAARLFEIGQQ